MMSKVKLNNKEKWIQYYANRMFDLWAQWQTPLGVSSEYIKQLKKTWKDFTVNH